MKNVKNGTKLKLKGGQKHKIGHIENNNEVRVPKLHQYVIQVNKRQTAQDKHHCYQLVWLYGIKNVKNGTKIKLKGVKNTKSVILKTLMK